MPKSANMANRRDERPTFEGLRGVRYQNIANRRDERPTFVRTPEAGKCWKVQTWQTVETRGLLLRGRVGGINQRKSNNSVLLAGGPAEQQLRATVRCPPEAGKTWKVQPWQTVETRGLLLRDHVGSAIKT